MTQPAQILNLACNHCGASLRVKSGTQYVTCGYCGSQLLVHEDGGSLYTEVLNRIDTKTTQIEKGVEIIKLQNDLERIDREYQNQTLEEKITEAQNNRSSNDRSGSPGGIIAAVVGGVIFLCVILTIAANVGTHSTSIPNVEGPSFTSSSPSGFALFPCVAVLVVMGVIGAIVFNVMKGMDEADQKALRDADYQRRRQKILNDIERQNRSDA